MDTVKRFFDAVANDEGLRERASALSGKHKPDEAAIKAELLSFAKSEGYDFTESELDAFTDRQRRELNDDELDAVAGGDRRCACYVGGGGGGTSEAGNTFVCVCVAYGQGGDAREYNWICSCFLDGSGR